MKLLRLVTLFFFVASAQAATTTLGVTTASSTDANTYATGAFTPAAGNLLVAIVHASDTVAAGQFTDSMAGSWAKISSVVNRTSLDTTYIFVSNTRYNAVSMTGTFDCTGDTATGAIITIVRVSGMTRTGADAVLQFASIANQAAAGTPAITFGASVLTGNATIVGVGNSTNAAGITPPASWSETPCSDTGYATPTTGMECATRDSGFTGTTVTWGGTSASAFGAIGVELNTTACTGICLVQSSMSGGTGTSLNPSFGSNTTAGNYIFIFVGQASATATITVGPSNSCLDTFTAGSMAPADGATSTIFFYWAKTAGGCASHVMTSSSAAAFDALVLEYSGIAAASAVDVDCKGTGTSTSLATGNCVTTVGNELLMAFGFQPAGAPISFTAGSGFLMRQQQAGTGHAAMFEDRTVSSSGTYTGTATTSSNTEWDMYMTTFKSATQAVITTQVGAFVVGP